MLNFKDVPSLHSKKIVSVLLYVKSAKGFTKLKLMTKIETYNWTWVENTSKIFWSKTFAYFKHLDSTDLKKRLKNMGVYIFLPFNQNFQD